MPVAPKRAVGSSEPSAYERFHSTFQAAVTQELEALVGDLRSAAARVAAVGDSLHHDVLGAAANGIDSVFICGGVHYRELGVPQAAAVPPTPAKLAALLRGFATEHEGTVPTHALAGFRL